MSSFITPFCVSVYVIRKTPDGARYLLIRRCGKSFTGMWQPVTGKINEKESAVEAALRELEEETGLFPFALYTADTVETFYMPDLDKITSIPAFVAFVEEEKVRLAPDEHDAYEWLELEYAKLRLVWSQQRAAIAHIHERFVLQEPNPLFYLSPSCPEQSRSATKR